jgi:hypothetical protein
MRYYRVDHRALFLFGYVYYLLAPMAVGYFQLMQGFPGMTLFHTSYASIPARQLSAYLLITISWLPAFLLGHFTFTLVYPYKHALSKFSSNSASRGIYWLAPILFIVMILFAYLNKGSLFAGYSAYDSASRGKMSTLLVVCNFFLCYQLLSDKRPSFIVMVTTLITAVLLLSMGGRMYVFQTFIILLIYKTSFAFRRWSGRHVLIFGIAATLIASLFGLWRMRAAIDINWMLYPLLAEPTFTWLSVSSFLAENQLPVLNLPSNFLTSFLQMVPKTFFDFQPYVVSVKSMGYTFQNPLGAESIWTTSVINFGTLGSLIFIYLAGFFFNLLRCLSTQSHFWAVYYILACAILPFQLFRDGFFIINKQLVFNFFLLPASCFLVLNMLSLLQAKQPETFRLRASS